VENLEEETVARLRYDPGNFLQELRNHYTSLSTDKRCSGTDPNPAAPEYKSKASPPHQSLFIQRINQNLIQSGERKSHLTLDA
jgi:hypothetical protein